MLLSDGQQLCGNIITAFPHSNFSIPHGFCMMIVAWPSCSCKEHNLGNVTLYGSMCGRGHLHPWQVATFGDFHQVKPLLINVNCVQYLIVLASIWINMILTPANLFELVFLCHGWLYQRGMFLQITFLCKMVCSGFAYPQLEGNSLKGSPLNDQYPFYVGFELIVE